jgi:PAS domain S-box-containing protein/putative nucleotidyltransferase with HDIG domain
MINQADIFQASILIVDDQEVNIILLDRMLRGAGYESVTSTMDPGTVCALHLKNRYDLILLDLQMPVLDGFQVMEGLKEMELDDYLPVLVITAQPGHKLRALQAGAKDFISKPFELADVLASVHNMLEVCLLYKELHKYTQVLELRVQSQNVDMEETEARFRTLVEHLPTVIYSSMAEDANTMLYVSPQIRNMLGYTPGEWLDNPGLWAINIHPEYRNHVLEETNGGGPGSRSFDMEYQMTARDGRLVWVRDQVTLMNDLEGRPKFWQGIMLDITERKLSEEKIRRQLEHLTALSAIERFTSANFDLELSLLEILNHVTKELGLDAADILMLNSNSQMLECAAGNGFRTKDLMKRRVRLGDGFAGRVALERQLVEIHNLVDEPNKLSLMNILEEENFIYYCGVPLVIKGSVKGVLEVFNRTALEPDPEWFEFLNSLAGQTAIAIESATLFDSLQRSNSELALAYDATIEGWSRALDLRDKETEGHTLRVTEMAVTLARASGFTEAELVQVRWGSLLHDIGKMGVPDGILLKPGPLTDEEWVEMKKHPVLAYEMLSPIRYLRLALDVPYFHHEKWDGTGYPHGLKERQIPLAARIFAVVDVWDALSSNRPYRAGWKKEKVRDHILASSGTHFDPQVVDVFMSVLQ